MALGNTMRMVALGAGIGIPVALALTRLLSVCCIRWSPTILLSCPSASECLSAWLSLRDTFRHSEPRGSIRSRRFGPNSWSDLAAGVACACTSGRTCVALPDCPKFVYIFRTHAAASPTRSRVNCSETAGSAPLTLTPP
jgi:hypothetical protein